MARHGGVALCAAVSPYRSTRNECRALVGGERFIEVFVNTPLEVCEARDTKGMYRQAREGKIKNFTGVDDPYEPPLRAELILDTIEHTAEENAAKASVKLSFPVVLFIFPAVLIVLGGPALIGLFKSALFAD